jgi:CheY-like chemotaxis protein
MTSDVPIARLRAEVCVPRITIVDDELGMEALCDALTYRGCEVNRIATVEAARSQMSDLLASDLVVLDIILPQSMTAFDALEARTGGMQLHREIRERSHEQRILAYTATNDAVVIDALRDDPYTAYLSKWETRSLKDVLYRVYRILGIEQVLPPRRPFIVHGQNEAAKLELKNYLQNTLHLREPIILHEQPNMGRTVIEKFEDYATPACLAFVLLTPDDQGASIDDSDDLKRRARQNVILELGWFLGRFGRSGGRVILLYQGPLELPSDLHGVVYIDISSGIVASGEKIRQEVNSVQI